MRVREGLPACSTAHALRARSVPHNAPPSQPRAGTVTRPFFHARQKIFAHPERFDTRTMHGGQVSILCIVLCIARRCSALCFRVQNLENKKCVCPFIYWAKRTFSSGGDKGSRTPDLLNAIETLYQLSYIPKWRKRRILSHIRRRMSIGFRLNVGVHPFCATTAKLHGSLPTRGQQIRVSVGKSRKPMSFSRITIGGL